MTDFNHDPPLIRPAMVERYRAARDRLEAELETMALTQLDAAYQTRGQRDRIVALATAYAELHYATRVADATIAAGLRP